MFYILIASAFIPLAVMFGDRIIKVQNFIINVPGMLGEGIRTPKELFNGFALLAIIFHGFWFNKLKPFKNITILLCVSWAFFISFISKYEFSFYFLFYTLLGFLAIAILSSLEKDIKTEKGTRLFLKAIAIVGLFQCFYATLQALVLDQFFIVRSTHFAYKIGDGQFSLRMVGFVGNPSLLSIYLAMILPIYLYLKERWAKFAFILALLTIFACDSTTGYVSSAIGILFYLFFANKKFFILLILLLIVSSSTLGNYFYKHHKNSFDNLFDGTGRVEIWKKAYENWIDKDGKSTLGAITGHGLRSWEYEMGIRDEPDIQKQWHEAHNDFFEVAYETGVIGLTLYLVFIASIFLAFFRNINRENTAMMSGLVSFGVSGLTLFPLYSSCIVLCAVIFTGLILNKKGEEICLRKSFLRLF